MVIGDFFGLLGSTVGVDLVRLFLKQDGDASKGLTLITWPSFLFIFYLEHFYDPDLF